MQRRLILLLAGGGVVLLALLAGCAPTAPPVSPASPTAAAAYPFVQREAPRFVVDFSRHSVCDTRFAGGQVLGTDESSGAAGVRVVVTGAGVTEPVSAVPSEASEMGVGGWRVSLLSLMEADAYTVELRDAATDALLAEPVTVSFPINCAENMVEVDFVQVADF